MEFKEHIETITFMQRPNENKENYLKLNVKKHLEIKKEDILFSHAYGEPPKEVWFKIDEIIESRKSSLKNYNYITCKTTKEVRNTRI